MEIFGYWILSKGNTALTSELFVDYKNLFTMCHKNFKYLVFVVIFQTIDYKNQPPFIENAQAVQVYSLSCNYRNYCKNHSIEFETHIKAFS